MQIPETRVPALKRKPNLESLTRAPSGRASRDVTKYCGFSRGPLLGAPQDLFENAPAPDLPRSSAALTNTNTPQALAHNQLSRDSSRYIPHAAHNLWDL